MFISVIGVSRLSDFPQVVSTYLRKSRFLACSAQSSDIKLSVYYGDGWGVGLLGAALYVLKTATCLLQLSVSLTCPSVRPTSRKSWETDNKVRGADGWLCSYNSLYAFKYQSIASHRFVSISLTEIFLSLISYNALVYPILKCTWIC